MDPYRIQQYLDEKLKMLNELMSISESLKKSLALSTLGEMTQWITKRQQIIERIDRIDHEIQTMSGLSSLNGMKWSDQMKEEVLSLSRAIEKGLQAVKALDEECRQQVMILRNEVKAELQKAFQELLTIRSYMRKTAEPPNFLDIRR